MLKRIVGETCWETWEGVMFLQHAEGITEWDELLSLERTNATASTSSSNRFKLSVNESWNTKTSPDPT